MFQQITICSIHNQPIIMYEGKIEGLIKAHCGVCLQEKFRDYELLLPEQIHQKYQHQLNQSMVLNKNITKELNELSKGISNFERKIMKELKAFEQLISDYISLISNWKAIVSQQFQEDNNCNINFDEQQWLNNYVKTKLQEKLLKIQKNTDIRYFKDLFDLLNGTNQVEQKINCKKLSMLNANYQCSSIAFHAINRILFVGTSCGFIKVYGFYNNKKMIQNLTIHTKNIVSLIFVKKSNLLVSGSNDNTIIIWKQGLQNQWEPHETLLGHIDSILCLFMNKDEDLMISGSAKDIKFWKQYDLNWKCEQTIDADFCFCLSLNASQKKLISCEFNSIKVFEHQGNSGWIVAQIIKIQGWGHQLSFLNDHQFVFQPKTKAFLEIYNYQERIKKFIQADLIKVQNSRNDDYFPIQIIEQKNIVMVKHGSYVNFFVKNKNQDYELCRKFQFGSHQIYGGLSNDGQFLIVGQTRKLQILLLKYLD